MHTIGANPRHFLHHLRDVRLIEMLDGAPLFLAPRPEPAHAPHDFLVVNVHPALELQPQSAGRKNPAAE
jgi:hypothetical protein